MRPENSMPAGQPTSYRPEFCELLIEHLKKGFSFEAFGAVADCCKATLYNWLDAHPEFLDAKKRGESHSRMKWEEIGMEGLWNSSGGPGEHHNLNTTAWIFNMKNRFGWRDSQPVEDEDTKKVSTISLNYVRNKKPKQDAS
jgi:hypothetical protein